MTDVFCDRLPILYRVNETQRLLGRAGRDKHQKLRKCHRSYRTVTIACIIRCNQMEAMAKRRYQQDLRKNNVIGSLRAIAYSYTEASYAQRLVEK
ncbi:hypothetical protein [Nostoc linckia]|uniref:hypothetical protein n=1 Tax=Nostoc linckia TaxID=92942 RepID=UPI0015D4CE96|nr:hypothetical protein [Nostoc linckia]